MPVSGITCGLDTSESVSVRVAEAEPNAVGVKTIEMVQLAPAATCEPQVLVWLKLDAFAPPIESPATVNGVVPWLVRVMFPGALAKLMACVPKP
jgi:hypothetical protein